MNDVEQESTNQRIKSWEVGGQATTFVKEQLSKIETKSGVLLTHVSMMIAITGLMLAVGHKSFWFEVVVAAELVVYLLLALACIRCQYQPDGVEFSVVMKRLTAEQGQAPRHKIRTMLEGEMIYREWLFRKTHRALFLLTIILMGTVVYGLFADEFGPNLEASA